MNAAFSNWGLTWTRSTAFSLSRLFLSQCFLKHSVLSLYLHCGIFLTTTSQNLLLHTWLPLTNIWNRLSFYEIAIYHYTIYPLLSAVAYNMAICLLCLETDETACGKCTSHTIMLKETSIYILYFKSLVIQIILKQNFMSKAVCTERDID